MASGTELRLRPQGMGDDAGVPGSFGGMEGGRGSLQPGNPRTPKTEHVGRGEKTGEPCRRFLLSSPFKSLVLACVAVVPIYGIFGFLPVAMVCLGVEGQRQLPHYLVSIWLAVQFLYNFAMSQFTDPGSPQHIKPTFEATGQFEMVFSDEIGTAKMTQVGSSEPLLYAPNWCDHCAHWKPPRTHHCSFCKRCILRMDHHCPFTGNCIGLRNHGHFVLMYLFAFLGLLYSMVWCAVAVYAFPASKELAASTLGDFLGIQNVPHTKWLTGMTGMLTSLIIRVFVRTNMQIAFHTVITVIALVAVLSLGLPALCFAAGNTTILEHHFPMKEYVQVKQQVYCPLGVGFYNRGLSANLLDLLGPGWAWRLLLPTRAGGPDPRCGVAPRPSERAREALMSRIRQVAEEGVQQQVRSCEQLGINLGPEAKTSGHVV